MEARERLIAALWAENERLRAENQALRQKKEALRARLALEVAKRFGPSSERRPASEPQPPTAPVPPGPTPATASETALAATPLEPAPAVPGDPALNLSPAVRLIRTPVVGRKNNTGHQTQRAGKMGAMMFSLILTCQLPGLAPFDYLVRYFQACAEHGGPPPDLSPFSPWLKPAVPPIPPLPT